MTEPTAADLTAAELLAQGLVARVDQLAAVEEFAAAPEVGGGRVLRVRVYGGFEVDILPDRGLDVGAVWWQGRPLSWTSPIRNRAPLDAPQGQQWLTRFNGGLITTCGLENVGPATDDYGMHGGHSHQPASDVRWSSRVDESGASVELTGVIDSVELFGRRVYVYRAITVGTSADGAPFVALRDRVRNEGTTPAVTALIYHVNFGAPTAVPGTQVLVDAVRATPREPSPLVPTERMLPDPTDEMMETVFEYEGVSDADGWATATLVPPGTGSPVELSWTSETLPRFFQWVFPTRGGWALGLEPGNAPMWGPDRAGDSLGAPVLEPGAEFVTEVRVSVPAASGG